LTLLLPLQLDDDSLLALFHVYDPEGVRQLQDMVQPCRISGSTTTTNPHA
jgi:hypothetical protein